MTKLIGAILILLGGLSFSLCILHRPRRRMDLLSQLDPELETLACELASGEGSLPEIMQLLSENGGPGARAFFRQAASRMVRLGEESFRELWEESVRGIAASLDPAELQALCALGPILGRYPREKQLEAIDQCRRTLAGRASELRKQWPVQIKLSLGLGLGGTLLVVLILL